MVQEVADIASAVLFAEAGVQLELYLASGKKKHDRYFWASIADGTIAWDKKKSANPDKVEPLESVEAEPAIMTARQWFDAIDVTQDGSLDSDEVATLYLTARGEKLGKKDLAKAMTTMNTDRNGRVTFDEFDSWWKEAGGDLEKHRDRAMTVVAGDMQLLLVAPDAQTKDRWIAGLDAILMLQGKTPTPAPAPEPEQEPERVIPAAASAEPPAAAGRRDSSDSPPAARLTPVDSSFTPATPSPIAKGAANPSAGAKPVPVKAATAWWLEQHGGTDAVPLSPGSVEQLGVWAATRQTVTQPSRPPTAPSADSADSPKKKSHDGYGALPVKTKDPITDPGFDSTGAPIPLVPPPAAPDAPGASPGPPVTADRHHAKSSTMNAVTSRWRDGDASEVPSSARSVSSAAGGSHALETHVVETPRAECFDEDSNHHPEGHWHQVKKEGEFSQHLSAHFLSRNAANGALFVDSDTTASGQVSGGGGSQGGSAVVHSVVEAERTLAGFADHGRGCHTPKFHDGSSGDHDESHGLKVRSTDNFPADCFGPFSVTSSNCFGLTFCGQWSIRGTRRATVLCRGTSTLQRILRRCSRTGRNTSSTHCTETTTRASTLRGRRYHTIRSCCGAAKSGTRWSTQQPPSMALLQRTSLIMMRI